MSAKQSILDKRARDESPGSESGSDDSNIDMPSGFTSDSFSDEESVYAELNWPTWKAFVKSLGLSSIQWTGPLGVIRIQQLFGTIQLGTTGITISTKDQAPIALSYQDVVDASSPIQIERRDDAVHFVGSVKQFRTFRRNLSDLIFDQLVPMASKQPFDAPGHVLAMKGEEEEEETK